MSTTEYLNQLNSPLIFTLELSYINTRIRIVQSLTEERLRVDGTLVTFQPYAFNIVPSYDDQTGLYTVRCDIDNVDRRLVLFINSLSLIAKSYVTMIYRIYTTSGTLLNTPFILYITRFNISNYQGSFHSEVDSYDFIRISRDIYDRRFRTLLNNR